MRDKIYKILLLGVILTAGYLLVYWFFKFSLPHPGMRDVKVEKLYPKSLVFTFNQPSHMWFYSTLVSEKTLFVSRPLKLLFKGSAEFAYYLYFITYFK